METIAESHFEDNRRTDNNDKLKVKPESCDALQKRGQKRYPENTGRLLRAPAW
jgi:hypothetical protein